MTGDPGSAARAPGFLDRVLAAWGVTEPPSPSIEYLDRLHEAYLENVPFENVTKLLKAARVNGPEAALRQPVEFWKDHLRHRSGGTCFAATYAYRFLLRYLGFPSRLLFCHLPAEEPQAHSALWVELGGRDLLIDVGYALPAPVALSRRAAVRRRTPYYDVETRPGTRDEFLVFSEDDRGSRFRYRFRLEPVEEDRYLAAWRETFRPDAPYMKRLALGRYRDGTRYLFKDLTRVFTITRAGESELALGPDPAPELAALFALPPALVRAALAALEKRVPARGLGTR